MEIVGHVVKLVGKTRDVGHNRRKWVFIVVRGKKSPGYGDHAIRGSHLLDKLRTSACNCDGSDRGLPLLLQLQLILLFKCSGDDAILHRSSAG